jgi:Domain of unknown function (DUF4326)
VNEEHGLDCMCYGCAPMIDPPTRIQRRRTRGWRMPEGAVYVGRPTVFGNPYEARRDGDRAEAVRLYREWLEGSGAHDDDHFDQGCVLCRLPELRGKDLACWCPPGEPCHADVLLEWANR